MEAKFEVVLTLDVDYKDDVRTFLNSLDDMRYSIKSIKDLKNGGWEWRLKKNWRLIEQVKNKMSGQYKLTEEEQYQIKTIIEKHITSFNGDLYLDNEISIKTNVSSAYIQMN